MKVLKAKIDWMLKWSNSPTLQILVDKIPTDLEYEQHGSCYFAEKEGYVNYYSYTRPDEGFGGRKFELKMKDGSVKTLIGPWSGNSAFAAASGFTPCMECSIIDNPVDYERGYTFYAGNITIELAKQVIKEFLPGVALLLPKELANNPFMTELSMEQSTIFGGRDCFATIVCADGFLKPGQSARWKE